MATKNVSTYVGRPTTHEGAPAKRITYYDALKRSVLACLLWEDTFYEEGEEIAKRISTLAASCTPKQVAELAEAARSTYNLRAVPLWLTMGLKGSHLKQTLAEVIQRPDELAEYLALYWLGGKKPLPAAAKKGLAMAFQKFDRYQLAKYKMEGRQIKLVDIMNLVHPKPPKGLEETYAQLIKGELKQHGTWEDRVSAGEGKKTDEQKALAMEKLIVENKMGGLAVLRNLRNMQEWGMKDETIRLAISQGSYKRVLPFRFVSAAKYAPRFEPELEAAMIKALSEAPKMPGTTAMLVDVSGSMDNQVAGKSEVKAYDAAASLAMLLREICEDLYIYSFSDRTVLIPNRRGFALRDAIVNSQYHSGTRGGAAITEANSKRPDRIICITDEQFHDRAPDPFKTGYMINVRAYQNGVGYGRWKHLDGWSDYLVRWIQEVEQGAKS